MKNFQEAMDADVVCGIVKRNLASGKLMHKEDIFVGLQIQAWTAHLAGPVEYANCISAEG